MRGLPHLGLTFCLRTMMTATARTTASCCGRCFSCSPACRLSMGRPHLGHHMTQAAPRLVHLGHHATRAASRLELKVDRATRQRTGLGGRRWAAGLLGRRWEGEWRRMREGGGRSEGRGIWARFFPFFLPDFSYSARCPLLSLARLATRSARSLALFHRATWMPSFCLAYALTFICSIAAPSDRRGEK